MTTVLLEFTARRGGNGAPGEKLLVNPEFIVAVLPGRPLGSGYAPSGARIVTASQRKVGTVESSLDIDVAESVDEITQKIREVSEGLARHGG